MASAEKRPKTVQQKLFFRESIISIGPKASDKALDENNNESLKSKSSEVMDRGSEVKKVVRKKFFIFVNNQFNAQLSCE